MSVDITSQVVHKCFFLQPYWVSLVHRVCNMEVIGSLDGFRLLIPPMPHDPKVSKNETKVLFVGS